MAKDPAFLFYPSDFNDGTQDFTNEEVGAYIRILLFQFSQGHLSIERIERKLGSDFAKLWPMLSTKFKKSPEGLYFNERLEFEITKRKAFSESRRKNVSKRYEKEVNNISSTYVDTSVLHMENENENRNVIENEIVIKERGAGENHFRKPEKNEIVEFLIDKYPQASVSGANEFSELFWCHYENNGWKVGKNKMKNWKLALVQWKDTMQKHLFPPSMQPLSFSIKGPKRNSQDVLAEGLRLIMEDERNGKYNP